METETITNDNAGQVPSEDPSNLDQTRNIKQVNQALGYEYDSSVVGNITKDNEYADPKNKEFIWPEGYIRINTARWVDSVAGPSALTPMLHIESFNGSTLNLDIIEYRGTKKEYEDGQIHISPIIQAFLDSPFNDVEMINRETERYMVKLDEERKRYDSFKKYYNPEEQRLFEEWKMNRDSDEDENSNFTQEDKNVEPRSVWELLSEATTEDLFKFKLDIFEQEVVQNSEDRELRSKIRKAKSICEVCAAYQTLLDNVGQPKSSEE